MSICLSCPRAYELFKQGIKHNVVKGEDPEHITDNHCSWGYNPAGLAYGDTIWIQAGR